MEKQTKILSSGSLVDRPMRTCNYTYTVFYGNVEFETEYIYFEADQNSSSIITFYRTSSAYPCQLKWQRFGFALTYYIFQPIMTVAKNRKAYYLRVFVLCSSYILLYVILNKCMCIIFAEVTKIMFNQ